LASATEIIDVKLVNLPVDSCLQYVVSAGVYMASSFECDSIKLFQFGPEQHLCPWKGSEISKLNESGCWMLCEHLCRRPMDASVSGVLLEAIFKVSCVG
jgi:hypothetical protein